PAMRSDHVPRRVRLRPVGRRGRPLPPLRHRRGDDRRRRTGPAAMTEITLPRLSDSMEEGTILSWLKAEGDTVAAGEELVEIETDKATITYEAPADGRLAIVAAAGETLPVGAPIAHIG